MSEAEEPPIQHNLLSERCFDSKQRTLRSLAGSGAGLAALTVLVFVTRGPALAVVVFAAVAGFAVFFVLISDTWDLLTGRAHFHWAFGVTILIGATILAILTVSGAVLGALVVPGVALLVFGTLKLFGSF